MSRLPAWIRQHLAALRALLVFTVVCGIAYPLVMVGLAQAALPHQANGSPVTFHGRVVGSGLLCQEFTTARGAPLPQYFQPRPSDTTGYGCNPLASGGSNLATTSKILARTIQARRQQVARFNGVSPAAVPPDAVTASASGLDPDISPAYAYLQVNRVARARHVSPAAVRALVASHVQGRTLGFLGEPRVNVLELNLALDQRFG
jgi:potassium-transporting ATPase KdpC subunit